MADDCSDVDEEHAFDDEVNEVEEMAEVSRIETLITDYIDDGAGLFSLSV